MVDFLTRCQLFVTDGLDLDHWFRAERELSVPDLPLSAEKDAVTVRITMEQFSGSPLVISVSHRSLLILRITEDESGNAVEGAHRDILRFVSLPVEIDPDYAFFAAIHRISIGLPLEITRDFLAPPRRPYG